MTTTHYEYEIRAGMFTAAAAANNGGSSSGSASFSPTVGSDLFHRVWDMFPGDDDMQQSNMPWFKYIGAEETHDYYYFCDVENVSSSSSGGGGGGVTKREIRSRVHICNNGGGSVRTENIYKESLGKIDIIISSSSAKQRKHQQQYGMRVSVSAETTVPESQLPASVMPHLVRIKKLRSFRYYSKNMDSSCWTYVLAMCWSGKTRDEAETALRLGHSTPHSFELEIECNPQAYRRYHQMGHEFVAESWIRKMLGLLSVGDVDLENAQLAGMRLLATTAEPPPPGDQQHQQENQEEEPKTKRLKRA